MNVFICETARWDEINHKASICEMMKVMDFVAVRYQDDFYRVIKNRFGPTGTFTSEEIGEVLKAAKKAGNRMASSSNTVLSQRYQNFPPMPANNHFSQQAANTTMLNSAMMPINTFLSGGGHTTYEMDYLVTKKVDDV